MRMPVPSRRALALGGVLLAFAAAAAAWPPLMTAWQAAVGIFLAGLSGVLAAGHS